MFRHATGMATLETTPYRTCAGTRRLPTRTTPFGTALTPRARRARCKRNHLLVDPNLMPSTARKGWRGCLACNRGHGTLRQARRQYGWELNLQDESDKHYAGIMRGIEVAA
jgi:hypothetical protein